MIRAQDISEHILKPIKIFLTKPRTLNKNQDETFESNKTHDYKQWSNKWIQNGGQADKPDGIGKRLGDLRSPQLVHNSFYVNFITGLSHEKSRANKSNKSGAKSILHFHLSHFFFCRWIFESLSKSSFFCVFANAQTFFFLSRTFPVYYVSNELFWKPEGAAGFDQIFTANKNFFENKNWKFVLFRRFHLNGADNFWAKGKSRISKATWEHVFRSILTVRKGPSPSQ